MRLKMQDCFANIYLIRTVEQKNDQGIFFNYHVSFLSSAPKDIVAEATKLFENLHEKGVIMDMSDLTNTENDEDKTTTEY